jgi:magnesium-transporting ATPase (P-type)
MTSQLFTYHKGKVIQALRYHFITRKEIRFMMVLVNVFAIVSAALFFMRKIDPLAFLISSVLWFALMLAFWYFLPMAIYKKTATFKEQLSATLNDTGILLENDRGSQHWNWTQFESMIESPHFFHLYFNSRSFFILPKDAFPGDDAHEARKLMRTNIKKG